MLTQPRKDRADYSLFAPDYSKPIVFCQDFFKKVIIS